MSAEQIKPGYKRTEVGVIPADWDVKSLGDIGDCLIGLTYSPQNVRNHGTLVLRSSNIQDGALAFDDNVYVDVEVPERIVVQNGDILVCVRNGSRRLIGKCALLDNRVTGQTFGAFMSVFRTPDSAFIFQQFQSDLIKQQIDENIGATINQITNANLNSFKIPFPSNTKERSAIAVALSDVDALLAQLNHLIAKKRDLKQATMQQLLTGQTRLPGFSGEWGVKRLGEVASLHRINVVPADQPTDHFTHFSLPAFDEGRSAVVELGSAIGSNKFRVPPDAILVSKLNPRIPRIWAPEVIPSNACASTEWLVLTPREEVERSFLFVACASPQFCEQMELGATGTTGSHQRISPTAVLRLNVTIPVNQEEQTAIAAVLSDMDAEIADLEARRDKTRFLKQGMMQELLTGRIRLV